MKKVLIATEKPFAKAAVDGIRKIVEGAGYELRLLEKYEAHSDFVKAVEDVDAIIIRSDKADQEVINAAKNLKIIVRAGAGYDNIDLSAATEKGVVAMNTPGQNSNAVAELVFGMMLSGVRNNFNGTAGTELRGKTLGLHAFGHIGKLVAEIANGFGMKVYAYSPSLSRNPERGKEHNVIAVKAPEELYDNCEIISLHMPANADTKQSINYDLMSRLPAKSMIINTARKEVMNEDDLLKIMEERPGFKYLSDIQPGCKAEIEEKYAGRYMFTAKKMGAQTSEANINAGLAAAQQIVNYLEKGDTTYQVNK